MPTSKTIPIEVKTYISNECQNFIENWVSKNQHRPQEELESINEYLVQKFTDHISDEIHKLLTEAFVK